jgi:hypothetical protein
MAKKWIQRAINPAHKGVLTAKAKRAGMTPMQFAAKHKHDSGLTGQQSRLALTLRSVAHGSRK